ncbi:MAG: YdiU family protein [Firmicutes bacterium]|nr:YdiU family protein [Bacillota bacterium]
MTKHKWNFDNTYAKLPPMFYTKQSPTPVRQPKLVIFNQDLADYLDAPFHLQTLAGNHSPEGAQPLAQAYMGHQFGFLSMLGDGRAILVGEQVNQHGQRFDIQLKGSGRTPYSRGGDGRAALGPMLREYIISEAMHALGIPTTRSLAVVSTGETVHREKELSGAILTRVAASHIRVGTFEYASHFGAAEDVRALADYTMARHYPHTETYGSFLHEVVKRQAHLIAMWQLIGFIHGVMNTDNMAICGETIDYGPCAFMDIYNPGTVFSSIDTEGRYAYKNQPKMATWNLTRFAETLLPLLHHDENEAIKIGTAEVKNFWNMYHANWLTGMRAKLGLVNEDAEDEGLITDLLQQMQHHKADYTNTFRGLALGETNEGVFALPQFRKWHDHWQARLARQLYTKDEVTNIMMQHNPAIIPRNHRVEEALSAAENGDLAVTHRLLHALKSPYAYNQAQDEYAKPPAYTPNCYKTFCGT